MQTIKLGRMTVILVATLMMCALSVWVGAAEMYMDDAIRNDILRYNADGTPFPTPGHSGAVFADLPMVTSVGQPHHMAYNPADNYLYVTSPNDSGADKWGDGRDFVTRYNATTGAKDTGWKVQVGNPTYTRLSDLVFAPDGSLYVMDGWNQWVTRINIGAQTTRTQYFWPNGGDIRGLAFDSAGYVYTSSPIDNQVHRYSPKSGTDNEWLDDATYNGALPSGYNPYDLVYGPDGWLYVHSNGGPVLRLNAAGVYDPGWIATSLGYNDFGMCFGPDRTLYCASYKPYHPIGGPLFGGACRTNTGMSLTFEWFAYLDDSYSYDVEWANLPGRIAGHVDMGSLNPDTYPMIVKIELIQGGSTVRTENVTLDSAGNYEITNVPAGAYDLQFKASTWSAAPGQQYYVDAGATNDILRFNANGSPAPTPGNTGAVFADLPMASGSTYVQPHYMAYNPADGYLYVTSPNDYGTMKWGDGSAYVTRYNVATGEKDSTWKVWIRDPIVGYAANMAFAPDGSLYVVDSTYQWAHKINIADQTSRSQYFWPDGGGIRGLVFDSAGYAYASKPSDKQVHRYSLKPGTDNEWLDDATYDGALATGYDPYLMTIGPDGWLYVGGNNSEIFRLDAQGHLDATWAVGTGVSWPAFNLTFGPDGMLYASGYTNVVRFNTATKARETVIDFDGIPNTVGIAWAQTGVRGAPNTIVQRIGGYTTICNVSLVNGDLNGDNAITPADAGIVLPNLDEKRN